MSSAYIKAKKSNALKFGFGEMAGAFCGETLPLQRSRGCWEKREENYVSLRLATPVTWFR